MVLNLEELILKAIFEDRPVGAEVSYYDYADSHPHCRLENLGKLHEGVSFAITGRILLTCERFSINLSIENATRDMALHINPRLPQNYIVRNSRVRNHWGKEEIATQLPFNLSRGNRFDIQILITEDGFMISSNGVHVADYKHRLPYGTIKAIEVRGDVEQVQIQRRIASYYPERQPHNTRNIPEKLLDIKFQETDDDDTIPKSAFYETMKSDVIAYTHWSQTAKSRLSGEENLLPLPYVGIFKRGSLKVGHAIEISGRIKLLPHSFYINLQDGVNIWPHQTVAFHFNPRFTAYSGANLGKAVVCRNAWYNGRWAKEERSELDTNLRPGKQFSLMIRCGKNSYIVYVDRTFITSFKHHMSPDIVSSVYIRGDVHLTDVVLRVPHLQEQPETNIIENPIAVNPITENPITENPITGKPITENPSFESVQAIDSTPMISALGSLEGSKGIDVPPEPTSN